MSKVWKYSPPITVSQSLMRAVHIPRNERTTCVEGAGAADSAKFSHASRLDQTHSGPRVMTSKRTTIFLFGRPEAASVKPDRCRPRASF